MSTHIQGDIVNGFYDMALLSWNNAMNPPLPLIAEPPAVQTNFNFGQDHEQIASKDTEVLKDSSRKPLEQHHDATKTRGEPRAKDEFSHFQMLTFELRLDRKRRRLGRREADRACLRYRQCSRS